MKQNSYIGVLLAQPHSGSALAFFFNWTGGNYYFIQLYVSRDGMSCMMSGLIHCMSRTKPPSESIHVFLDDTCSRMQSLDRRNPIKSLLEKKILNILGMHLFIILVYFLFHKFKLDNYSWTIKSIKLIHPISQLQLKNKTKMTAQLPCHSPSANLNRITFKDFWKINISRDALSQEIGCCKSLGQQ